MTTLDKAFSDADIALAPGKQAPMTLNMRNQIHGAIERAAERAGLSAETGGGRPGRVGDVEDGGDEWVVCVLVRIPKRFVR